MVSCRLSLFFLWVWLRAGIFLAATLCPIDLGAVACKVSNFVFGMVPVMGSNSSVDDEF